MALSNGFDDHHDDEDEYFGIGQKYIYRYNEDDDENEE